MFVIRNVKAEDLSPWPVSGEFGYTTAEGTTQENEKTRQISARAVKNLIYGTSFKVLILASLGGGTVQVYISFAVRYDACKLQAVLKV